ncbi:MAG: hypothetical protein KatS3mg113_0010 [Planctomycetaceae bacterium]|nr:MAG: hypothetical protein KatS3mg113_0010 [Planctomycetaceae bacterium]
MVIGRYIPVSFTTMIFEHTEEGVTVRLAILCEETSWYGRDLVRAALARGHVCSRWDFRALQGGVCQQREMFEVTSSPWPVATYDALVVRSMPAGSLEQVVVRMDWLARWEAAGCRVINPSKALECAIDKYLTTSRLAAAGLPTPDTWVGESAEAACAAFQQLGGDVVVKPLFGSEGRGILRVSEPDLAWRVFQTLERLQAVIYLQRFIDHGGSDLRLLVLGTQVLGGMRRTASQDFRTNVARQGQASSHQPSPLECELAVKAAQVTGNLFAGIDLLYDRAGQPYVIEVNGVPGWRAFGRVNQLDVADLLIAWLEQTR